MFCIQQVVLHNTDMPHNIYQVELNKLMLEEKKKNYIIIGKYFFFEHFLCKNAEIASHISVFV